MSTCSASKAKVSSAYMDWDVPGKKVKVWVRFGSQIAWTRYGMCVDSLKADARNFISANTED